MSPPVSFSGVGVPQDTGVLFHLFPDRGGSSSKPTLIRTTPDSGTHDKPDSYPQHGGLSPSLEIGRGVGEAQELCFMYVYIFIMRYVTPTRRGGVRGRVPSTRIDRRGEETKYLTLNKYSRRSRLGETTKIPPLYPRRSRPPGCTDPRPEGERDAGVLARPLSSRVPVLPAPRPRVRPSGGPSGRRTTRPTCAPAGGAACERSRGGTTPSSRRRASPTGPRGARTPARQPAVPARHSLRRTAGGAVDAWKPAWRVGSGPGVE